MVRTKAFLASVSKAGAGGQGRDPTLTSVRDAALGKDAEVRTGGAIGPMRLREFLPRV